MSKYCILALLSVFLILPGCKSPGGTDNTSTKMVIFMKDSIKLTVPDMDLKEGVYEAGTNEGTEVVLPDGSYVKLSGGGSAGNLMLVVNQNDGTDQEAKTDAQASASANVNSPNSTSDTGDVATSEEDTE